LLRQKYKNLDLYSLLRLPTDEVEIDYEEFRNAFAKLRNKIIDLFNENKVDMATHMTEDIDKVINLGISNVGMYHSRRPLLKNKLGNIITQDINNMYYYHNRLHGYELEKYL